MPTPKAGEKRNDYMHRCISYVKQESPGKKRMFYVLKCKALWEKHKGKSGG